MSKLPPELALLSACCRWPPSQSRIDAVQTAAAAAIDWDHFERVVARHRVTALARDGLRQAGVAVPDPIGARIDARAARSAKKALLMACETARLQNAFDAAGLECLFVKGSTLANLAFGNIAIKQSWDIDLLTSPEHALSGRELLKSMGYVQTNPPDPDEGKFIRLVELGKECAFHNATQDVTVELHWRLTDDRRVLPSVDAQAPTQVTPLGGAAVKTFDDNILFAYLCVHGTAHGWARLKWLADLAAFLARQGMPPTEQLYAESVALGAGRSPAVALLLCHELMGLQLPSKLLRTIKSDRLAVLLAANARWCIAYGRGALEFKTPYSWPGLRVVASQAIMVPGAGFFFGALRSRWTGADDRMEIVLPRGLGFLYHLMRIPRWLWRNRPK